MNPAAAADPGLITVQSAHPVTETIDRLLAQVLQRDLTVMGRVDHAAAAAKVGLSLRPTDLLIFGNPVTGTPLMVCDQRMGIDLPLKALAWQDEAGMVWLAANDPATYKQRFGLSAACDPVLARITTLLRTLLDAAAAP